MKAFIILCLLAVTLAAPSNVQSFATNFVTNALTPAQQILQIPGCQAGLSSQLNICSQLSTTQSFYFQKYYQCLTHNVSYVSNQCANVYCNELGHLNTFGVNCDDYTYNYTDLQWVQQTPQLIINMSCNIGEISGCIEVLNGLEPYCQTVTDTHDINYFQDFFDCIIANSTMQAIDGCSKCYCLRSRFNDFGVNCNLTKPLTPQQQIENIPGCENAINVAVAQCQNLNSSQIDYYHKFYECVNANPLIRVVNPTCPFLYCAEIEHLNVFGVNCMNFTYDLSNATNNTHTPTWRNLTCHVEQIDGCEGALNQVVPLCQKSVPTNATNYYDSFYTCVQNNPLISAAKGCASCYCMNLELDVDCGDTTPQQMIKTMKKAYNN